MKIYTLGSNSFMNKMVKVTDELVAMNINSFIHENYRQLVNGELDYQVQLWTAGEKARVKKEYDYFRQHYKHILESDAILIVNEEKNGIQNYIGGNVLIEMGQAYVNDKKIFFLYGMPTDKRIAYLDEIIALEPICLEGELENIKKYI